MRATLMNKNNKVILMDFDNVFGTVTKIVEKYDTKFLPVGVKNQKGEISRAELSEWWKDRSIPASRDGIDEVLKKFNLKSSNELVARSFGLSLSDQYWFMPEKSTPELKWEDINYFQNDFSPDVGEAFFEPGTRIKDFNLKSPDNTSDGWLKKKWIIRNGKRCLVKAGSGLARQEPFNEVIATKFMELLDIYPHVKYELYSDGEEYCSICENMIDTQTELVTANYFSKLKKKRNDVSTYVHLANLASENNIDSFESFIDKMLVLDYLIANKDRHFGNFGFIRNVETLEFMGVAPIYDSGTSLWHDEPNINAQKPQPSKPFRDTHEEQIGLVRSFDWLDLTKLDNISEICMEILNKDKYLSEERRLALCKGLQDRINKLSDAIEKRPF